MFYDLFEWVVGLNLFIRDLVYLYVCIFVCLLIYFGLDFFMGVFYWFLVFLVRMGLYMFLNVL